VTDILTADQIDDLFGSTNVNEVWIIKDLTGSTPTFRIWHAGTHEFSSVYTFPGKVGSVLTAVSSAAAILEAQNPERQKDDEKTGTRGSPPE
jgi:hypothetical protein